MIRDSLESFIMPPHAIAMLQIYSEEATSVSGPAINPPAAYALAQNFPNPFNPATTIRFSLPQREHVTLKVFDVLGREVATLVDNEILAAGRHVRNWGAYSGASGVYFYRMTAGKFRETKKMILMR